MKKPALLLIVLLAMTAPASAAFLGGNSRLGAEFPDAGSRHVAGELSREGLPDSGGTWLRRAAECFVAPAKLPPNPYGKLGSPAHQAKVAEVTEGIRSRGLIPQAEVPVGTVNGQKATRVMDVVAVDPATGRIVEVHQVGKALKSNPKVPIARERAALRDVRHSPELRGAERHFHEY